jgi:hypothetical protein
MKTIFYPENERGKNNIGWLKANFSFSFASYMMLIKCILAR